MLHGAKWGGFGWDAPGTPQPLLTLPTLTSSHKFISLKIESHEALGALPRQEGRGFICR